MSIHPIVRQIIDRDCHVSMTAREVIRHVISKLRDGYQTFRGMSKPDRRRLIDDCIKHHQANFDLYRAVMTGHVAKSRRSPAGSQKPTLPPGHVSGPELTRIMRQHKVSIANLAFRLGTTQKRFREARSVGLSDTLAVRDWLEAITGTDPGPIPEKYRIRQANQETLCSFCGCPLLMGNEAYEYVNDIFCSRHCCRRSRDWE
jgi:hypothetical protein